MSLTRDQVQSLAPDQQVFAAGQKLSRPAHWQGLGRNGQVVWGECRGSAVYLVQADLMELAFKCTCPSRKQPCKHVVGLLTLAGTDLPESPPPERVESWLERRAARATHGAPEPGASADGGAKRKEASSTEKTKRVEQRLARVRAGIDALDLWLEDMVRNGLAGLEAQPTGFWEGQAARLVDAQAPGLASRLRRMAKIPGSSPDWPERLLGELGRISLLTHAFRRIEDLDPALQHDVRGLIGWTLSTEQVATLGEKVTDEWYAAAQAVDNTEHPRVQRTWLTGLRTGRTALLLQFAVGRTAPFPWIATPGTCQEMELHFWPGAAPQRARVERRLSEPHPLPGRVPGHTDVEAFLGRVALTLASNPWTDRFLCVLHDVVPVRQESGRWWVRDRCGAGLPLHGDAHWELLAVSGGYPLDLYAEWDGHQLSAVSYQLPAIGQGSVVRLPPSPLSLALDTPPMRRDARRGSTAMGRDCRATETATEGPSYVYPDPWMPPDGQRLIADS
jgi:hypothetical protein